MNFMAEQKQQPLRPTVAAAAAAGASTPAANNQPYSLGAHDEQEEGESRGGTYFMEGKQILYGVKFD
jgi:hypothetical protein